MPDLFDYQPDADIGIIRDVSTNGNETLYLQLDTKIPLTPEFLAELNAPLKARKWKDVYGLLYGYAQETLDRGGVSHAMLQAACGVIKVNAAEATRLRKVPKSGIQPIKP